MANTQRPLADLKISHLWRFSTVRLNPIGISPFYNMNITLKDLRSMAAMAQFSPRELSHPVLSFIETNGELAGETLLSVDSDSVRVISPVTN